MIGVLALALASPREDGEGYEASDQWAEAVTAYQTCVATGADLDVRFCATRLNELEPHARDAFAGWKVLTDIRRNYVRLGSDAALEQMETALAARPDGPAAPSMRLWIANERSKRGEPVAEISALPPKAAEYLQATEEARAARQWRSNVGMGGIFVAGVYALVAWRGPGAWAGRSALAAGVLLGLVPAAIAGVYDPTFAPGFLRAGAVASLSVLAAPRVHPGLAAAGTVGGLVGTAWWNDWLASLGF